MQASLSPLQTASIPGVHLPLSPPATPASCKWPWGISAQGPVGSQSRCTQLHRLQGRWGAWCRLVKVMRTGPPAPAHRQQPGRGPHRHVDGEAGPHRRAGLEDRPPPAWTYAEALIIACHSGPSQMAQPDSYGNETLASDGSFCPSGNFKLTNNNILNCGSARLQRAQRAPLPPPGLASEEGRGERGGCTSRAAIPTHRWGSPMMPARQSDCLKVTRQRIGGTGRPMHVAVLLAPFPLKMSPEGRLLATVILGVCLITSWCQELRLCINHPTQSSA